MAAERRRRERQDSEKADTLILSRWLSFLPDPPVSSDARLSALHDADDAVDRISRLPDTLLRDVVSRLPAKGAARTAALSRRWRGVWRSAPLVLADGANGDLIPAAAVSLALRAHPGPFRRVHLTASRLAENQIVPLESV